MPPDILGIPALILFIILLVLGIVLLVLWIFLPFVVFDIKTRLDKIHAQFDQLISLQRTLLDRLTSPPPSLDELPPFVREPSDSTLKPKQSLCKNCGTYYVYGLPKCSSCGKPPPRGWDRRACPRS